MASYKVGILNSVRRTSCSVISTQPTRSQSGYIVLLPEIPDDTEETNPVLSKVGTIDYQKASTTQYFNAVSKLAIEHESTLLRIDGPVKADDQKELPSVFSSLEVEGSQLETAWNATRLTRIVNAHEMPGPVFEKIQSKVRKARGSKFQNKPLYAACKELAKENLPTADKALVNKYVLEGRMNGLELSEKALTGVKQNMVKLDEARAAFRKRVKLATEKFHHIVGDKTMMKDFPSDLLRTMALDKNKPSQGPWCVTLEPHILSRFLEHCPDREQRWNAWMANRSRASEGSVTELNNNAEIGNIRARRNDQAKYLGFSNYAHMSLATKMADSVESITGMFGLISKKARPAMEKELENLQAFASERGHTGELEAWDVAYWRRKQKRAEFSYDEGEIREYFPLPSVLEGVFGVSEELFGIKVQEEKNHKAWHSDVRYFSVKNDVGSDLGYFYLDPYIRPGAKVLARSQKGWVVPERSRSALAGTKPSATLVFNFPPPLHGLPSLLTYDEVQALFKNFGFALQLFLTESTYHEVNPINSAPWEAIEAPGEFFQLLTTEPSVIGRVSNHFETGHSLPAETASMLVKAQRHMSAFDLCNEMYLAHFDLECYSSTTYWLDITKKLWPQYTPFPLEKKDNHPCSFMEIFSENWAASYYAHLWARMIGADIFTAFQEVGLENITQSKEVGHRLRNTFLANSGMMDANELFRQFRGRDFSPDALLSICGLKKSKKH